MRPLRRVGRGGIGVLKRFGWAHDVRLPAPDRLGRLALSVKRLVLHEGRRTALSLMEKAGVPISVVSRWAGHYDASFTLKQYVHADHIEDMRQGTVALGQLYKLNEGV